VSSATDLKQTVRSADPDHFEQIVERLAVRAEDERTGRVRRALPRALSRGTAPKAASKSRPR